jgi:hypothetical protein
MTVPRKTPYVWTTWITKLLAQENHCVWASWFQAHYQQYEKVASDFPLEQWRAEHSQMVAELAAALRVDGYKVSVEDENFFKVQSKNGATLSGKSDLVAGRDGHVIVIDCKTGQRRASDEQQVLIYMRMLPLYFPQYQGLVITGRVQYRDGQVDLGPEKLDTQFETNLRHIMECVTGAAVPVRTPSLQECRYCNLTQNDCPDRMEPPAVEHDLF